MRGGRHGIMGRWSSLVVYFLVGAPLIAGGHYYLWSRLVAGLARFGETLLYVSCGTGHSGPPMRFAAPAEITHIVLRAV
jgi:predicted MPP superfamily phosphohydrolase